MAGESAMERLAAGLRPYAYHTDRSSLGDDREAWLYLRAYMRLRLWIGVLGLSLPVLLVLGERLRGEDVQTSLSAYYGTDSRDLFVGVLVVVGAFLVAYRVSESHLDNWLATAAGLLVVVVAFVPNTSPQWGWLHFTAAALFILSLGLITLRFGRSEASRSDRVFNDSQRRWRATLHYVCFGVILAFVALGAVVGLLKSATDEPDWWWITYNIAIVEAGAVWAFATSWIVKGMELFNTRERGMAQGKKPAE